jgi:hypothetical protein
MGGTGGLTDPAGRQSVRMFIRLLEYSFGRLGASRNYFSVELLVVLNSP